MTHDSGDICLCTGRRLLIVICVLCSSLTAVAQPPLPRTPAVANTAKWQPCGEGPWGPMEKLRVTLDVAESRFPQDQTNPQTVRWFLPAGSPESLSQLLAGLGIKPDDRDAFLQQPIQFRGRNAMLLPTDEFILGLDAAVRAAFYGFLGKSPSNELQHQPYQFSGDDFETNLRSSRLSDQTRGVMRQLAYRSGDLILFADRDVLLRSIVNSSERHEAIRTLIRFPSYQVRLVLSPDTAVDTIAEYWSDGNSDHVLPMLQQLADCSSQVSVAELLSPFAKSRLNTYPQRNPSRPLSGPDCFWTAANFFNELPDDAYFNPDIVASVIKHQYHPVETPRYGDLALFVSSSPTGGNVPIHAATYIADDLLFSKNGYHYWKPWVLNSKQELLAMYGIHTGVQLHYFRQHSTISTHSPSVDDLTP